MKCIACLTRGYNNMEEYKKLIKRNKHIINNLNDKNIDILIFHEGNITEEQQKNIHNETPELNIEFINITHIAFFDDKKNIENEIDEVKHFSLGYRHMCSFWFINFFEIVKKYDKLLRIDEDCFIDSNIDDIFLQLNKYIFVSATICSDVDFATRGLNDFSLHFLFKNKEDFAFKTFIPKSPFGPYTNLIGFDLNKVINNNAFQKYKNEIDNSNMIYKRRWGDMPLWGEAIYYFFGEDLLKIDHTIKYFHESHNNYINYTDQKEK